MAASAHTKANDGRAPFLARTLRVEDAPPSPLPRRVLQCLLALLALVGIALAAGRLDIVAVAEGRLVPRTLVKIVQPADGGVLREILVDEGDAVVAGQPLARLDARIADADVRALRNELVARMLQARRIEAELAGQPLVRAAEDPDEAFERMAALLRANVDAQRDALEQASAQVARIIRELAAAQAMCDKLERTVPIAQTIASRFERLRAEGFVSELFALDRDRERIEREHELRAQEHSVEALAQGKVQAERQLAQLGSAYRRQLQLERAETAMQITRLREELDKQLVRRERVELSAPQAGIVKEIATRTIGAVVGTGSVLMTIVPAGEPLDAEVAIRNDDAGFVRAGQRAQLKIGAFPFQKFGLVESEVLRVGPDASEQPSQSAHEPAAIGTYRARLALASQSVAFDESRLPLVPGMIVQAEIHLGRRAVLDYVLAPVRKAWHEAARER